MNNKQRRVMVTGAASGIGLGIAEHFGKLGHPVVLVDINEAALDKAASELSQKGIDATALVIDITNQQSIDDAAVACHDNPISILINNAGIQHVSPLEEFPPEKWRQLIDVMLIGPAMLTRAFMPMMRESNFGRIINIGSLHSLVASPFKSAYISAKHGLLGLAKTIALETGNADITINTVCPAYVRTPLVDKQIADQAKNHGISEQEVIETIMLKPMPKKAFIDIEEIAATAEFLASDQAKNITAQAIALDGGWTAQ